ncbi:arginine deiminase [Borrelia anserina]|uniref:Arginine deiminase n=2 Tax=Borrelia anserina TaxID=143 RepID=W5SUU7_BORAN|nr:arginine deiminase [Borrelia anserina]AHH08816.1 Arginine deiminase [Borrelia anserina BA2]APR65256.1 arginine deiminase [Borrelia anserina Es]UPA07184.1 arginine deiminase [Borrelia anserina]
MGYLKPINVFSEIGRLRKVLLHRPGEELENLTPSIMKKLLFDDIPYLEVARQEHDVFADTLRHNGVEVVYIEDLVSETLSESNDIKEQFISQFILEAGIRTENKTKALKDYFYNMSVKDMISKMIAGVTRDDLKGYRSGSLNSLVNSEYPLIVDPMPNILFIRDPFASVGHGVTINRMKTKVRRRETIFAEYIFKYHPIYKENVPIWYTRYEDTTLEGGDELILSRDVLAIGVSERTDAESVEKVAHKLFQQKTSFSTILAFQIPQSRSYMHLDTVFTQVDYTTFTSFTSDDMKFTIYALTYNLDSDSIKVKCEKAKLEDILSFYLGCKVNIIKCAGGNLIHGAREQWNDGANTLAIAPGEVIVYSRNYVTNRLLEECGIKVYAIPSSELSRGRGGPRCMSMPLIREDI